ncbi:MAG TPA: maleylpyruvate isomerase family mycothiol-dependent enzyme [Propionibacteriaceae bacterium]|nr:maleylpyruvate isomerase family mycothiol-dependent enzyme [Propionibacteriaceae bacterium]
MNDTEVWSAIDDQRRRTADLLEQLSEEEWRRPSLCPGWTVRDVAAHLTLQELRIADALAAVIRHPGSLGGINRMIRLSARHKAEQPVEQLIGELRATVGSRRSNVGVTNMETLIDILVHSQDIAIPLERDLEMPTAAAATAASRVRSQLGTRTGRVFSDLGAHRFRLIATDATWCEGDGLEVRGPISAILLLLTGRLAALPRLTGAGADELRSQRLAT